MSGFTDYREDTALSNVLAGGVDVALHTSDPTDNPDGTTEVSASDYDRVTVSETDWTVTQGNPTEALNDVEIYFGEAQNNWGNVTWASIVNYDGSGNTIWEVTVDLGSSGGDVPAGVEVSFPAGDLSVTLD